MSELSICLCVPPPPPPGPGERPGCEGEVRGRAATAPPTPGTPPSGPGAAAVPP